jgi:hypothetical protein
VSVLIAAVTALTIVGSVRAAPMCAHVSASLGAGGNGMTGGMYSWSLSITNRGTKSCSIRGRPFVRVPPTGYPVTVTDMQRGEFGLEQGTGSVRLAPGQSAHAVVVIARNCGDFSRRVARTVRVEVGFGGARATVSGEACARAGATVIVGVFGRG